MYHLPENKIDENSCGCKYELGPISKERNGRGGYVSYQHKKLIDECFAHQKQRLGIEKVKRELKMFPDKTSESIYKTLDKMIDELYEAGVDVSYFPDKAKMIVKRYAIKISKKYNEKN